MKPALEMKIKPGLEIPSRVLLGPGPSMVDPRVLQAMNQPVVGHLDPVFLQIMDATQEYLRYTFQTENQLTLPISGTGSAAMEAAVANLVEPGTAVLICINGFFGGRLAEMARRYGGEITTIHKPWGEVFQAEEVRKALLEHPAKIVAIVHGETSTGAEQPLEAIAQVVHEQGGLFLVDTVASLGGTRLQIDQTGIDVCYTGSQKCLSAPPGLGPITFNEKAEAHLAERKTPVTSWYLDLSLLQKYWGEGRVYHHTAPVSMIYALHEALRLTAEEGLENRWQRHQKCAELLWEGLAELGISCLVPRENRLVSLTTVVVPEGVDEAQVRRKLLENYNIEIAGGLGELKGKVWRVGLMGYSAQEENVRHLLSALKEILAK